MRCHLAPWYVTDDIRFPADVARDNLGEHCPDATPGDGTSGKDDTRTDDLGAPDPSDPAGIRGGVTPPWPAG